MKASTFAGGLKLSAPSEIKTEDFVTLPAPQKVTIPLKQHHGLPCKALVKKKAAVQQGQIIGEGISTSIHATISGKIAEVDQAFPLLTGEQVPAITIDSAVSEEEPPPSGEINPIQSDSIKGKILEAGVIDYFSPASPILDKISLAQRHKVNTLIISCLDEFNILGSQATIALVHTQKLLEGIKILQDLLAPKKTYLAVYENIYPHLNFQSDQLKDIEVIPVLAKHPQHKAPLLVKSLTDQEYPPEMIPEELGISILAGETAYSISQLINMPKPVLDKPVTILGSQLSSPKNLLVKIGSPIRDIINYLQVPEEDIGKIVQGGLLSGKALPNLDYPVTKQTNQLVIQSREELIEYPNRVCIKCGYCVEVCPMRLMPFMLSGFSETGNYELAEKYDIFSCIECGSCAFICPSKIPMVQWIQLGKSELSSQRSQYNEFAQACRLT